MIDPYKILARNHRIGGLQPEDPIFDLIKDKLDRNDFNFGSNTYNRYNGRQITQYPAKSTENIILLHLKNSLEKCFQIKFSNRNKIIDKLFDSFSMLKSLNDYTVIKFDFRKYFYTVSTDYVFEKYVKNSQLDRPDKEYIRLFVESNSYCVAGIPIINYLIEIISKELDEKIRLAFSKKGLIFYERYVDDGIIILNQYVEKKEARAIINQVIKDVFQDSSIKAKFPNRVRLNDAKFQVINKRYLTRDSTFSFLGYSLTLSMDFKDTKFGITKRKREKYQNKINSMVRKHYRPGNKMSEELLRHIIKAHCSRVVYCSHSIRQNDVWISKGIITNYNRLKDYRSNIDPDTEDFLKNIYKNAFVSAGFKAPYFLSQPRYSLRENMIKNTAMIFDELIGMDKKQLIKELEKLGNYSRNQKHKYGSIAREYLVAIKVGY